MVRFHLWTLLSVTTVSAILFAVGKHLDFETVSVSSALLAAFAPTACFSLAAVAAPTQRSIRRVLRYLLLLVSMAFGAVVGGSEHGSSFLGAAIILIVLVWVPQLIVLEVCSAYRSALSGSRLL